MVDTTIPYQIVVFTRHHSISGGLFLRDQRLSDFLNDGRDTNIMLRSCTVAKLENPAKVIEKTQISFIPKAGIVVAFEPPQKGPPTPGRFIKYPKQKYEVYFLTDGMEVHGNIHMHGTLDLMHILTSAGANFVPITEARVNLEANPDFALNQVTILANTRLIRFIGEVQPKPQTGPIP